MRKRIYWQNRIENAWERRPILWLSGVRKTGKTLLCQSIPGIEYFDCELAGDRRQLEDAHAFLAKVAGRRIVIDEIHRLKDPQVLLGISARDYPSVKLLVTGPSELRSTPDFSSGILAESIEEIWLTPVMSAGLRDFERPSVPHRLEAGGLPQFFLGDNPTEKQFQEWVDIYWAKDVQDSFRLAKRWSYQRLMERIFFDSGSVFEASRYTDSCEISRPSVASYLEVMEKTYVAHVIRPFSSRQPTEIVSAPKVYAFDTGFVRCVRKARNPGAPNYANLWEHLILNEIHSRRQTRDVQYWRNKQGAMVDFLLVEGGKPAVTIQCSWSADAADTSSIKSFRRLYPGGENWVVANDIEKPFGLSERGVRFDFMNLKGLAEQLDTGVVAVSA